MTGVSNTLAVGGNRPPDEIATEIGLEVDHRPVATRAAAVISPAGTGWAIRA